MTHMGNLASQRMFNHKLFFSVDCDLWKGSPGTAVKLLPCDHEVMGSSPGNSLLHKRRERLWSDPSPDPVQMGATCIRTPLIGCYLWNMLGSI
jgi:hypothetical protein